MSNEFNEENLVIGPITGMWFSNKDVMFDFYKEHARLSGFCIIKRISNKKGGDIVRYVQYGCDRSRKPRNKYVTKRRNCRARINGILEENVLAGGPENLGCAPKDYRNYILKSRKLQLQEGDAQSLLKFFSDMQQKDREFYYSVDMDSFGRLRNAVWVHSHSKVAYEEFHDVICLDTTYLVNRYNMPFALFVGVNQHRQSILLGCALMSSEDTTSYKMVLSTWLGALNNVRPLAIMTDQCDSIKAVINALMPNTVHRYCIWHIFAKLPTKLSGVLDGKIVKAEFKVLVLDSINVAEFERRWTDYIIKYNLDVRDWFYKLYLEKEKWVHVYLNDHFWAGMLSTQRSEGMHAFFDGFITRQSTLKLFAQQYELAIRAKFEKELGAEYRSRCFEPKCLSEFACEEKLQVCYTREVFEFFQVQLRKLSHCEISTPEDHQANPGVEKYTITNSLFRSFNTRDPFVFTVEYTPIGEYLSCSCKCFETRGGYPRMTSEYMMYRELLKHFERVCDIVLDTEVMRQYIKYDFNRLEHDLLNWDDDMIVPNWDLEDTHDGVSEGEGEGGGEGEGEGEGRNIRDPRYVASRGRPRLNRYRGRIDSYFRSSKTGDGSGVKGNMRGRGGGRSGGRGSGRGRARGGGRGGGRSGGTHRLAEGIEQNDTIVPPQSSLLDLNDKANWEVEDLTV
nr:protein FAR-RED IMPAIRED RESPONSE 1-like [Nicotiana tomentosiformis]